MGIQWFRSFHFRHRDRCVALRPDFLRTARRPYRNHRRAISEPSVHTYSSLWKSSRQNNNNKRNTMFESSFYLNCVKLLCECAKVNVRVHSTGNEVIRRREKKKREEHRIKKGGKKLTWLLPKQVDVAISHSWIQWLRHRSLGMT